MSIDPQARLFYGYIQPDEQKERYKTLDFEAGQTTLWREIHGEHKYGCYGGIYGYEGNLGFFLAVEEALYETEWDHVFRLTQENFQVKQTWHEALYQAAKEWGLDLTGLQPGWYLVCLYF